MKNTVLFMLFLWVYIPPSYSQIIKDTVFIKFDKETDLIKRDKEGNTNIWLYNILYEEELIQYKKKLARYKTKVKKYEKNLVFPPALRSPIKPPRYYIFFLTTKIQSTHNQNCSDDKKIDFYNRIKLNELNPYKKLIFIVKYMTKM